MQQQISFSARPDMESALPIPVHFGAHLRLLRDRHGLRQKEIVRHLGGWQQAAYSKVEKGTRAPLFEQIEPMYRALKKAGVQLTKQDRDHFYVLARDLLESRQTRHPRQSDDIWNRLYAKLAAIDGFPLTRETVSSLLPRTQHKRAPLVPRREVGHLLGREAWLTQVIELATKPSPVKVLVLQGPPGSGKTSELHRVANQFAQHPSRYEVVLCEPAPIQLERLDPTDILEQLLGDVLEVVGSPYAVMPTNSLSARISYVLNSLSRLDHPTVICLDNAEHVFNDEGTLGPIWQHFFVQFAQANHQAMLILASQEWPAGTFLAESQLLVTVDVPRLSQKEGGNLLETLGLKNISEELLARTVDAVGGMPLCIEWLVRLVREPYLRDEWAEFEEEDDSAVLARLLDDVAIFGGAVALRVQPLLDRVLKRLSNEAATALQDLAVTPVPLGAPALKVLYQTPKVLRELREASLLVSYPQRVQLLPMVAAQVRQKLSESQVRAAEERLALALTHWLNSTRISMREQGVVITELAYLLLRRHQLLTAAELLLSYGWLSSHVGQMLHLARRVREVLQAQPWDDAPENELETEYGALLLHDYLDSYLGEEIDDHTRAAAYKRTLASVSANQVTISPLMQVYLLDHILREYATIERFEEALSLFENCFQRLEPLFASDLELHSTLVSKQAALYNRWSGYAKSHGLLEEARRMQERAIDIYQSCLVLLEQALQEAEEGTLRKSILRKKQATFLNNLAYQLNMVGRYEEALKIVNACIDLKEQGYAERDSLAASYGEKSQILAALGQFQEALWLDERARKEIRRCAEAGDTLAEEEQWIYQVNQGRLYLLLGRVEEAEPLLEEAKEKIQPRRRIFQDMAHDALLEIRRGRAQSAPHPFQLDWRWVERYRSLSAYDAYWWLAHAGPFTEEEQETWNQLFVSPVNKETKDRLKKLLLVSRNRELEAAVAEEREPRLRYPAIEIDLVRQRIADFLALDADIRENEPNAIVRLLYHGAIHDELCFLRLIEATYEGNDERFWLLTQQLYSLPTESEWHYIMDRVKQIVLQGLQREDTAQSSHQVIQVLLQAGIALDLSSDMKVVGGVKRGISRTAQKPRVISAQATKRFFEALLEEGGFRKWEVTLDPSASGPRVESGLQEMFLPDLPHSLVDIREYALHEILGHVTRSSAGERSLLGLLGMGTKGYMPTEEGLADHHERYGATLHDEPFDDSGTWLGPLAVALASGREGVAPLTFSQLFAFFKPFLLLYRLLWRDDEERETAERKAQDNARVLSLRTFRGAPNLQQKGICLTKDIVYLRGHLLISQTVEEDEIILDRLSVGKVALELLPLLDELGIEACESSSILRKRLYDPELDAYILSFEREDRDGLLQNQ